MNIPPILFFFPLCPPPPPRETPTFQNPTVRSKWAHTCYTRHKCCCTPAVALVQVGLGYGSNAQKKKLHLHVRTAGIAKLTRRERDPSTPHPCTTAPTTRHSRGSASTAASAGNSPASPPWLTHPGREAFPDRKKRGTHGLAAAEHQLLQLVVHAVAVAVRQPTGGLPFSARRGVAVVEPPRDARPCHARCCASGLA